MGIAANRPPSEWLIDRSFLPLSCFRAPAGRLVRGLQAPFGRPYVVLYIISLSCASLLLLNAF